MSDDGEQNVISDSTLNPDGLASELSEPGPTSNSGSAESRSKIDPNLARLEPRDFKKSGFTWDLDSVGSSTEKYGDRALILAFGGIGVDLVSKVATASRMAASDGISMLFGAVTGICLSVAALITLALLMAGIWSMAKGRTGAREMIIAGAWPLALIVMYLILKFFVIR